MNGRYRYGWAVALLVGVAALVAVWWVVRVPDPTPDDRSARIELDAADACLDKGDFPQALAHAGAAGRVYASLAARFPARADAKRGVARADLRLGRAYYEYGYPAAAEPFFTQAVTDFAALRESGDADPDLEAEFLDATDWRANSWDQVGWGEYTGESRKTVAAGWEALAARSDAKPRWLANHGKTLEKEADGLYAVAEAATVADRPAAVAACRARYDAAASHFRRASQGEPGNVAFKLRLLESSLSVAELLALAGDPPGMAAALPPLESLAAELRAANPGKADVLRAHLRTRQDRARYHQLAGKPDDLRSALAIHTELAAECRARISAFPKQAVWVTGAVEQAQNAGKMAFILKDWKAARAAFEQAVGTWEAHPDRFPADQLGTWYLDLIAHLAVSLVQAGDKPAARAVMERGPKFATDHGLADAEKVFGAHLERVAAAAGVH